MNRQSSLRALRDARPRSRPGFETSIARYDALRAQITATPPPPTRRPRRRASRRRLIGLSAAAAAAFSVVGVTFALTVSATSPPSAFAAARQALAATAGAGSGTMTMTTTALGTVWTLETTRWNDGDLAISSGARHLIGLDRQLLLIGGHAYLQTADGTWLRYAHEADVGPKLGGVVKLAHDNVTGSTAEQILSLATGLRKTVKPDGITDYTGTIPNSNADPVSKPTDDSIMRLINNLRGGYEPGAPFGDHGGLQLRMIAGGDGLVKQITLSFRRYDPATSAKLGTTTWKVTYSRLGSTSPITAPAVSTPATPGKAPDAGQTPTTPRSTGAAR
jgi:hypothetical protein